MIVDRPIYVTNKGLAELEEELAHLENVKRPELIDRLQESKGGGDWMDMTEDTLIEEELAFVNGRIQEISYMLEHAEIIGRGNEDDQVDVGETVVLELPDGSEETYTIVGVAEADPAAGYISNESPMGKALLNHKVGEEVTVKAPMGELRFKIKAVKSREPR